MGLVPESPGGTEEGPSSTPAGLNDAVGTPNSCLQYVLLALGACVLGALTVWICARLSYSAMVDCAVNLDSYSELNLVALLFGLAPAVAVVSAVLSLLAARLHPAAGILVAVVIAALVGYLLLSGTAATVQQHGDLGHCPSGVPPWWPGWLPR